MRISGNMAQTVIISIEIMKTGITELLSQKIIIEVAVMLWSHIFNHLINLSGSNLAPMTPNKSKRRAISKRLVFTNCL